MRLSNKLKWNIYISDTFVNINALSIVTINEFQTGQSVCFIYKVMNSLVSSHTLYLCLILTLTLSYTTKESDNLHELYSRTEFRSSGMRIRGVFVRNTICDRIRRLQTFLV